MRVWALSDVHTDYKENLIWCEELSTTEYQNDVLILAGDVTDDLPTLRRTLQLFKQRWAHVFFTPGNHDLWVRRGEKARYDSIGKLEAVVGVCAELGVRTAPVCISGLWIVPLLSWYHKSWDREPDLAGAAPAHKMMTDFHVCSWPDPGLNAHDTSLAEYFDAMNDEPLRPVLAALQQAQQQNQPQQDMQQWQDQAQQQGQQDMQQQPQYQQPQQQQDHAQRPQQQGELDTVGAAAQLGARIAEVNGAGIADASRGSAPMAPAAAAANAATAGGGCGSAMPGGGSPAGMAGAALPVPANGRGPASALHGCSGGSGGDGIDGPPAASTAANVQGNGHAAAGNPQRPPLITFSHFLPYQELLPEKRMLRHPNLAKAVGSDPLADRIAALQPDCHVFGHTHFGWDARLPNSPSPHTRFVQCPLAYPPERAKRGMGSWKPKLIWDSAYGGVTPQADSFWSSVYAQRPRDPGNLQPAPWCCLDWK